MTLIEWDNVEIFPPPFENALLSSNYQLYLSNTHTIPIKSIPGSPKVALLLEETTRFVYGVK